MREVEAGEPKMVERWRNPWGRDGVRGCWGCWERVEYGDHLTGMGRFPLLFCSILMLFDVHKSVLVNPVSEVASRISSDFL